MTNTIYSANQRQAMTYLGYKRWLVRQAFAEWHHSQAMESSTQLPSQDDATLQTSINGRQAQLKTYLQHLTSTDELSKRKDNSFTDVANNSSLDEPIDESINRHDNQRKSGFAKKSSYAVDENKAKANEAIAVDSFQLDNLSVSLSKQMTLLTWQSQMMQNDICLALPPLWGTREALTLFATELESELFATAVRVCGLGEIADKVEQVEDYIRAQQSSLVLAEALVNQRQTDSNTMVIIVNDALPSLQAFKESMINNAGVELFTLLHPYECLQNPLKKAQLWQQLMNLQVKL